MKIFEGRFRGARVEDVHFEAKDPVEADRLFHGFCSARGVRFIEIREWLVDLKPFADLPADSVPVERPSERVSVQEQRENLRRRAAGARVDA